MTDNKIIKALECCSKNNLCESCPYLGIGHCPEMLQGDALDLINRQKAEIERLQHEIHCCQAIAIGKFAGKLESRLANNTDISAVGYQSVIDDIENLVEEMVGE